MRRVLSLALLVVAAARPAVAQDALTRGFDLERRGLWAEAAASFRSILDRDPANLPALLGAERVLSQIGQRDTILMLARRAATRDSVNATLRQVELRAARAVGGEEAAAEVLRRWMAAAPRSESPYRELARSLLALGRVDDARLAVQQARTGLANPHALHTELALTEVAAGNWPRAAAEWREAVERMPTMANAAVFSLQAAPAATRDRVIRGLTDPDSTAAGRRLAADLLLGWNDAPRAWALLRTVLPTAAGPRTAVLRGFADRARVQPGIEAQRVAGEALERLADGAAGAAAARLRIESARAFWAAGDAGAARRVLRAMADDPASPPDVAASSIGTLIEMSVRDGDVADAARLLAQRHDRLPVGEALRFGLMVARGWLARGDLDRAEAAVAADSSLAGDEIRGWSAAYRGRLAAARDLLRAAGVRGEDADATHRAAMVALLGAVDSDSSVALGAALQRAARGDTAGAARALADLARRDGEFRQPQPRAALLAFAAGYAAAAGDTTLAEGLWRAVADSLPDTSPAPAALLALARLAVRRGDVAQATRRLEAMILSYPQSALVPEARRELDQVRGMVPRS